MRVLLDTHVWLWMLTEPERLGEAAELVGAADTDLLLSAASTWEIVIKHGLGRLDLPTPPASYVPDRIRSTQVTPLPIEHSHTIEVAALPQLHRDPFDRLLVAQARILGVPLLSADPRIAAYDVDVLRID
ncbi:type II toxin-antitoxin system VapC family toxin [Nitriliruptor alkaliphilus]|uniref:type II toxin-antitoxin system VapC family toxin n=1 Tax=Nitriliruptor alkaliphilus TaxID=427918 RepID=UPI000698F97E|nr:type II toxin-antitoxin system VapC family toxin [Nitriliruptor alkaliphilus]